MRPLWPGVPLAFGSAALFGASTPLAKALLGDVSPWMLAGLLYLASGLGLLVLRLLRRARDGWTLGSSTVTPTVPTYIIGTVIEAHAERQRRSDTSDNGAVHSIG